jgi:hypothetical protein
MRLAHRDWWTIACYRGVGAVENRRELNQCLREQMTSRERADWDSGIVVAILAASAVWSFFAWYGHASLGFIVAGAVYGTAYQRVDPFYRAQQQYLADLETELRLQNARVRREQEGPSLLSRTTPTRS